jgi:predicted amidohydrolase
MRVAAVQFKPDKGDPTTSLARLCALADHAAQDADLVVLPEMAATGYIFRSADAVRPVAEPARGPTLAALGPVAARHGAWMVVGFPEADGDRLFNSALVIDPAGELRFTYRKTLLFDADLPWASPGDSGYASFDGEAGRFTVGICMDLNDDDFVAWCAQSGARALAFPTNWVDEGSDVWPYWAWRMRDTGVALVAAHTYGHDDGTDFSGRSAVIDGLTVLAAAPREGDGVIRADIQSR